MISNQSPQSKSKGIEALVPMVDLFAVLAVMFMIYSNDTITYAKQEHVAEIQKIVEQAKEERQQITEEEQARKDRREYLAQKAGKSLEQLKSEQARKAQELIEKFTNMIAVQQSQAAIQYDELVSNIEFEHEEKLDKELASLNEESQSELAKKKVELDTDLANRTLQLEQEKKAELVLAKLQHDRDVVSKVIELTAEKQEALADSRQEHVQLLQEQKSTLEREREDELRALDQKHREAIASAEKAMDDTREALAASDQQRQEESALQELELRRHKKVLARMERSLKAQAASQAARLEAENERALAEAERRRLDALSAQERELEARKQLELARAEEGRIAQAASLTAKLEAEKELALVKAQQERLNALTEQGRTLEAQRQQELAKAERKLEETAAQLKAERERALAKADEAEKLASKTGLQLAKLVDELDPYLKAEEAKQKIVARLKENFKDFDSEAVEIDEKTGNVKLRFQETYFARGAHVLSEDMKSLLRIMIPKYAKSIYENRDAAKHVASLKISGMTSPVYLGKYVDINGTSPRTEMARRYNMTLSNKRALAMYNFIFDKSEMSNYRYRHRLKADMGIAALGFQNATPVANELVGKTADCIEYDCKHEQAAVLQFTLLSGD